jgi:hypothetical protein
MSGDGKIRSAVHEHYGDSLAHSAMVGMTHWDKMGGADDLPGPKPMMFFAPDRIKKRGADWGAAGLDAKVAESWHPFAEWAGKWLEVKRGKGPEQLKAAYLEVLEGKIDPKVGHVLSPGD